MACCQRAALARGNRAISESMVCVDLTYDIFRFFRRSFAISELEVLVLASPRLFVERSKFLNNRHGGCRVDSSFKYSTKSFRARCSRLKSVLSSVSLNSKIPTSDKTLKRFRGRSRQVQARGQRAAHYKRIWIVSEGLYFVFMRG